MLLSRIHFDKYTTQCFKKNFLDPYIARQLRSLTSQIFSDTSWFFFRQHYIRFVNAYHGDSDVIHEISDVLTSRTGMKRRVVLTVFAVNVTFDRFFSVGPNFLKLLKRNNMRDRLVSIV